MSFTAIFATFALLALLLIFGAAYKFKGLKMAFLAAGVAFVLFAGLLMALVYAIVNSM